MSSTGGSHNEESSRRIPQIKHVYVRKGKKAQVHKEIENTGYNGCQPQEENQPQHENQPTREKRSPGDGLMFSDALVTPNLTTLSNTQLLMYVEFIAAANNRVQNDEAAVDVINHSGK